MTKALTVFSFTWNGMPLLYSGQELPNKKRLQFFDKDAIEWKENYELHDFYKALFLLKDDNPALSAADKRTVTKLLPTDAENNILSYIRQCDNNEVLVILNLHSAPINFRFLDGQISGTYRNVFDKNDTTFITGQPIEMKPWGYQLFEKVTPAK